MYYSLDFRQGAIRGADVSRARPFFGPLALNFICPIDGLTLKSEPGVLRCANGHSYDKAREGYYNLLLVQQKASLNPGDNPEMVNARRSFLEADHYKRMTEKLGELVFASQSETILDAGCGEGYFLGTLKATFPNLRLVGTDISKAAVKAAAKKYKDISWAVASNKQLPFAEGSIGTILSLFGFPNWECFKRVLAPAGQVIVLDPGPDHLMELREIIYPEVKRAELVSVQAAIDTGFSLEREDRLELTFKLTSASAIHDLLAMTPHGYRMSIEGRKRAQDLENLQGRASVVFRVLRSPWAQRHGNP
jgi:23S rRNA (guanine745-N1)-methyltransferase